MGFGGADGRGPTIGAHSAVGGTASVGGGIAQPAAAITVQPTSPAQAVPDQAVVVRPIAFTPPRGMPAYGLDLSGTAMVRHVQPPVDMVSLGERISVLEEGLRQAGERQRAWEARKDEELKSAKEAQEARQNQIESSLGDITRMLTDLTANRSQGGGGAGSAAGNAGRGINL